MGPNTSSRAILGNPKIDHNNSMKNYHDNKYLFFLEIIIYIIDKSKVYTDGKTRACQYKTF